MRVLTMAILTAAAVAAAAPAQAQTYDPHYPVCMAGLWQDQLFRLPLHLAAAMQRHGIGPLGGVPHQSLLRLSAFEAGGPTPSPPLLDC